MCDSLKLPLDEVELSMGMSTDFEHAVSFFFFLSHLREQNLYKQLLDWFEVTSFNTSFS